MNDKLKSILLWLAVLPGSLLAGILVLFPLHWILYKTLTSFVEPYPELPEKVIGPLASAWAMVAAAVSIAPTHKKIVGIIIAILWTFLAGIGFALGFTEFRYGNKQYELSFGGLPVVAGVIGSIIGTVSIGKKDDE